MNKLTNTKDINIEEYSGNTVIGLGTAPNQYYRVKALGNILIDGDLVVTGNGGVGSDKYITRSYTGDGVTLTFALTVYTPGPNGPIQHSASSVLVYLNGVAQIGGTNYTVDSNGANVVFGSGDAPLATDTVHIVELPI